MPSFLNETSGRGPRWHRLPHVRGNDRGNQREKGRPPRGIGRPRRRVRPASGCRRAIHSGGARRLRHARAPRRPRRPLPWPGTSRRLRPHPPRPARPPPTGSRRAAADPVIPIRSTLAQSSRPAAPRLFASQVSRGAAPQGRWGLAPSSASLTNARIPVWTPARSRPHSCWHLCGRACRAPLAAVGVRGRRGVQKAVASGAARGESAAEPPPAERIRP